MKFQTKIWMRKVNKKNPAKVTGREHKGGNIGVYWDSSPQLSRNSAEVEQREAQTSQRGFKSIPRVAFVNTETGELKKTKQTNRGPDWSVAICIPHLIFNQGRISSFKPQLVRNSASYKTTYWIWAETGTQQETKHKRDTAEHTGHDVAVCLHLKDRRNSGEDSKVLVYIARAVAEGLWPRDVRATLPLHKAPKTTMPRKMILYVSARGTKMSSAVFLIHTMHQTFVFLSWLRSCFYEQPWSTKLRLPKTSLWSAKTFKSCLQL